MDRVGHTLFAPSEYSVATHNWGLIDVAHNNTWTFAQTLREITHALLHNSKPHPPQGNGFLNVVMIRKLME